MGQQESPTQCSTPTPRGPLDKIMSPRVGYFGQKSYSDLILRGRGTLEVKLDRAIRVWGTKYCFNPVRPGGHHAPPNVFYHCAQMLSRRKLNLGDF